jgi:acyl-homoserine lactone synthase
MIYLVDKSNRHNFSTQLKEMHRIRHDIYVGRRGWKALERDDGLDIDQFDTEAATYLMGVDSMGRVTAALRLMPTTGPHLLRDVFSHTVTWGRVPCSDKIYEFTRYFIVSEREHAAGRRHAAGQLLCAMFEFGLSMGLTHISLLCDTFFLPTILELGWKTRPLGLPTPYDEGSCVALLFEVSEAALVSTREARGVEGPVLVYSPTPPPYAAIDLTRVAA